jgi:hypothetical protein
VEGLLQALRDRTVDRRFMILGQGRFCPGSRGRWSTGYHLLVTVVIGEPKLLPQNLAVMLAKPGCPAFLMYGDGAATGEGARERQRHTQSGVVHGTKELPGRQLWILENSAGIGNWCQHKTALHGLLVQLTQGEMGQEGC